MNKKREQLENKKKQGNKQTNIRNTKKTKRTKEIRQNKKKTKETTKRKQTGNKMKIKRKHTPKRPTGALTQMIGCLVQFLIQISGAMYLASDIERIVVPLFI